MRKSSDRLGAVAFGWLVVVAGAHVPGVAQATTPTAITDDDLYGPARAPLGLTASLGLRSDLVRSPGLDAFSAGDGLAQSSLAVAFSPGGSGRSGAAIGFEWNHGSSVAFARAAEASLTVDRLSLTLEGRFPVWRRLSAFGRLAPGVLRDSARLLDASVAGGAYAGGPTVAVLEQTKWVPALDASAGVAFQLADVRGRGSPTFGFWLMADGGYGYAGEHDIVLRSGADTQPGRADEAVRLGRLSMRGPFLRARLAVTF